LPTVRRYCYIGRVTSKYDFAVFDGIVAVSICRDDDFAGTARVDLFAVVDVDLNDGAARRVGSGVGHKAAKLGTCRSERGWRTIATSNEAKLKAGPSASAIPGIDDTVRPGR
jgi:hypothetical protein